MIDFWDILGNRHDVSDTGPARDSVDLLLQVKYLPKVST